MSLQARRRPAAVARGESLLRVVSQVRSRTDGPRNRAIRVTRYLQRAQILKTGLSRPTHWRESLYELSKRAIDISAAAALLVATLPICAVAAALIRATSPGPVLFRQRRIGRGGRVFWCYKLRTMMVDAEERLQQDPELRRVFEVNYKLDIDPRVTPVGALLRKTSIDELPQLFNVLVGDMSLVGPRPIVPPELERYGPHGERLLSVKPGLSGFWQVCGRSATTYEERVQMDLAYIERRGLLMDLRLMLMTPIAVISRKGAR
jgi:exopolysaccharide production protein ExoY